MFYPSTYLIKKYRRLKNKYTIMRFQEFSKFIIKPHLFENKQQYKQIMDAMVNADIISQERANDLLKEVKSTLKRADRIIWWLRWWRIKETGQVIDAKIQELQNQWEFVQSGRDAGPDAPQSAEELQQRVQQLENLYKKITKKDFDYYVNQPSVFSEFQNVFNVLALGNHWSTMFEQSPQVNAVEWEANLSPTELFRRLEQAEKEWKQKQAEEIEPEPDDKIIIDYGKYAWVKLDREYCEIEGKAMGHCGNMGDPLGGDRILSFRSKIGETKQKPHLTFILDQSGYLGEMKGRGNDKPSEKYHPYIIDLLQKDFVKGIKGGGYLPENNFEMEDLDDDVAEKLIDAKPALGGLSTIFGKQGMSEEVIDAFESQLRSSELDYEDIVKDGEDSYIVINEFSDLIEISNQFSVDRTVSDLIDIFEDSDTYENISNMVDGTLGEDGYAKELYDELGGDVQEKIKKYAKEDAGETVDIDSFEDMIEESLDVRRMFMSALFDGIYSGTTAKAEKYLGEWLEENGFVQTEGSEKYQLRLSIELMLDFMLTAGAGEYIANVSELGDWGDILDTVTSISDPTISIDNVYAYNEAAAKEKLQEEIEELFGESS